jgi:hypothetical protein
MENNNTTTLLNEGAIQDFIRSVFGRNFKSSVGAAAEAALNKALTDVVSGGRKFTIAALRKTPEYKTAFKDLTLEASRVKYGKTFDDLVKFDKNAAQKLINDVQTGIEKQIADNAAVGKNLIDGDVMTATGRLKKVTKDVNLGKATAADLKAAAKELTANVKAQTKWAEAQKAIAGMDKISVGKLQKLLAADAKVTTGSGTKIAGEVGENVVIQARTGIFTMTKDQLKKFPGRIKKVVVNNKMLSTLAVAGLSVYALYQFFGATDDSSTILVDENGNPIKDTAPVGGEWLPCIKKMIDSKEGVISKSTGGQISVVVKTSDFPEGVQYYLNGRVRNVATGDMGSYVCKDDMVVKENKPTINEVVGRILRERLLKEQQSDAQVDSDAETMVDLLDFPVSGSDMQSALKLLQKYSTSPRGKDFLLAYQDTGLGSGDLKKTLSYITTTQASSARAKRSMLSMISQIESGVTPPAPAPTPDNTKTGGGSGTTITWDKDKKKSDGGGDNSSGGTVKKKSSYRDCEGEEFPLAYGCKSTKIAEVQRCLGVADDGKLGPKTMKAIADNKYDTSRGLSKDVYDAIKTNCVPVEKRREKIDPINLPVKGLDMSSLAPNSIKMPDLSKMIQMNSQPADLYQVLMDAGYITGDSRSTVLDDGTIVPATKRVKYKGPDLEEEVLGKLDSIMLGMGYGRIKQKLDKRYGVKYVWLQK